MYSIGPAVKISLGAIYFSDHKIITYNPISQDGSMMKLHRVAKTIAKNHGSRSGGETSDELQYAPL